MLFSDFKVLQNLLKPHKVYNLYFFRSFNRFSIDSRSIKKGQGFVAIKGKHHDGHKYIQDAVSKGAKFIVAQQYRPLKKKVPFFVVSDTYQSLSSIVNYIRKKKKPFVIATGGNADLMRKFCRQIDKVDKNLALKGLNLLTIDRF